MFKLVKKHDRLTDKAVKVIYNKYGLTHLNPLEDEAFFYSAEYLQTKNGKQVEVLGFNFFTIDGEDTGYEHVRILDPVYSSADFPTYNNKEIDKKNRRFHNQLGEYTKLYYAPNLNQTEYKSWRQVADDVSIPIVITEGCAKALAITECGFPAVGVVGIWNWRKNADDYYKKMNEGKFVDKEDIEKQFTLEYDGVKIKGRHFIIMFDSEVSYRPEIMHAEASLAKHLIELGAEVKCGRIPNSFDKKTGIDDYLKQFKSPQVRHYQLDKLVKEGVVYNPDNWVVQLLMSQYIKTKTNGDKPYYQISNGEYVSLGSIRERFAEVANQKIKRKSPTTMPDGSITMEDKYFPIDNIKIFQKQKKAIFDGVVSDPSMDRFFYIKDKHYYNSFEGFAVPAIPNDNLAQLFVNHVMALFTEQDPNDNSKGVPNEARAMDFIDWLTFIIQKKKISGQAWVIHSPEKGIGKSLLVEALKPIFNSKHSARSLMANLSEEILTNNFNAELDGKLLVVFDEVGTIRSNESLTRLRELITNDSIKINAKYAQPYIATNNANFLMFSNHSNCIKLDENERRFNIFESRAPKNTPEHYAELARVFNTPEFHSALLYYLSNREMTSNFNFGEAKKDEHFSNMLDLSAGEHLSLLKEILNTHIMTSIEIKENSLYTSLSEANKKSFDNFLLYGSNKFRTGKQYIRTLDKRLCLYFPSRNGRNDKQIVEDFINEVKTFAYKYGNV